MPRVVRFGTDFLADRRGGVAIMFGLMIFGIVLAAGVAVDYGRIVHTKTRLAQAADAAALAAGRALLDGRLGDTDVRELAIRFFEANLDEGTKFGSAAPPTVTIKRATGEVQIDATAAVPMTLTRVAGFTTVDVPVSAVTKFEDRDIELALALDVTLSMRGAGKIGALKTATKKLIDVLLPDEGTKNLVRIGLAPYSSGVNAGAFARAATGKNRVSCTFEREGPNPAGYQAPGPNNYLKTAGDRGVIRGAECPDDAEVVALSSDKRMLKQAVDRYSTVGTTAGHLGAMWASYLLSPEWSGVFGGRSAPVDFKDPKTVKAMVLMTDGLFNTIGGHNYGNRSDEARESQELAVKVCEGLRTEGVQVYAVGFKLSEIRDWREREAAADTLRRCAGENLYFDAEEEQDLVDVFIAIAKQINNLRLTH